MIIIQKYSLFKAINEELIFRQRQSILEHISSCDGDEYFYFVRKKIFLFSYRQP